MDNHRNDIIHLIDSGSVPSQQVDQLIGLGKIYPDAKNWIDFLQHLFLWLGLLSLSFSTLFFIAYNWDAMGRFAKFALVEGALIVLVAVYWKTHLSHPLVSKISLLSASILVGVLLAFYGQTYQTGADTWQLFASWALFILPWTLLSRFSIQWIVWIGLLNVAAILYLNTYPELFRFVFRSNTKALWAILLINAFAWVIWERLEAKWSWLSGRWAVRLLAMVSLFALTIIIIEIIFNRQGTQLWAGWHAYQLFAGLFWLITLSLVYLVYRRIKPDLFMLSLGAFSTVVVLTSLIGHTLFETVADTGVFFILTFVVIGLGTAAALWLKHVQVSLLNEKRGSI